MDGNLTYDTNSLQTYNRITRVGINTNKIQHVGRPDTVGDVLEQANANNSDVPTDDDVHRIVVLGGTIHGSSQSDLDTRIDAFNAIFMKRKKNLDIPYGGSTRRYVPLKFNAFSIERNDRSLYATYGIEALCKPYGCDITTTSLISKLAHTTATYTATPTVAGTAPQQLPIFTITLTAITGAGDYVQISNNLNNQSIMIYGLGLVTGDVITIDCLNKEVRVNGNLVDYYGTFLELEPGTANITYSDGFTTRTVDIVASYTKRYR